MVVKISSLIFVVTIITLVHCWSGHVCHHDEPYYVSHSYCKTRFIWCWSWGKIHELKYRSVPNCCTGWKGTHSDSSNCITAICRPNCHNGGRCDTPGHCVCTDGHHGDRCGLSWNTTIPIGKRFNS